MKKIKRRDKFKIYADLLSAIQSECFNETENIVLSRIQTKINVPFDRFKTYITDLIKLNLIQDEVSLRVTKEGLQYIKEFNKITNYMKSIGISYDR